MAEEKEIIGQEREVIEIPTQALDESETETNKTETEIERYIREQKERRREEEAEGKPRRGYSHSDIIWNYFYSKDREHYRQGERVFFEGDTLYSYGHHFRLAIKTKYGRYIINADKYSISTSGHQSIAIGTAPEGTPQIPFSAVERAGINVFEIDIIDKTADTWEERHIRDEEGKIKTIEIYHLGATLFRHLGTFYLSSLDHESRHLQYFLVELKHGATKVEEAFRDISGLSDKEYEAYQSGEIKRQGEYFFIPVGSTAELKELMKKNGIKPVLNIIKGVNLGERIYHNAPSRNPHIARDFLSLSIGYFVRGTVRHPEHGMMKLGETWHWVKINNVVNSWSAGGSVD